MIIICEYCRQYECPPSCPSFIGNISGVGSRIGRCDSCESNIYEDDKYYRKGEKMLCSECAEELISPELLEFLGCEDIKDFFDMLY